MSLEIITPSYGPDLELCRDLNRSIRRHARDAVHRVIVPRADRPAFTQALGGHAIIDLDEDYLPGLRRVPRNLWINPCRPWPPVRGWIAQQLVKLEAAARSQAQLVVLADSDLILIRAVDDSSFTVDGSPWFFRWDGAIDEQLPRHVRWHENARRLLGLEPTVSLPLPDYICWPCVWEPAVVRDLLDRVALVGRRPWPSVIGAQLHFSEMVLYGVFVDAFDPPGNRAAISSTGCYVHTEEAPLDEVSLAEIVARRAPTDIAVMISAKSGTSLEQRRRAFAEFL